jgi:hypothetical protein
MEVTVQLAEALLLNELEDLGEVLHPKELMELLLQVAQLLQEQLIQ